MANTYFKTGGSQNYGGYSNPKFDDLLKQSDRELDPTKRRALLDQMQDCSTRIRPGCSSGTPITC